MARRGRQEFSVQEAVNMDSFGDWNYETKAVDETYVNYQYITSTNPAKKVVIYNTTGDAAFDSDEYFTIKLNNNTGAGKEIVIDAAANLPFTISGLLITQLDIKSSDEETTNDLSVLSFH